MSPDPRCNCTLGVLLEKRRIDQSTFINLHSVIFDFLLHCRVTVTSPGSVLHLCSRSASLPHFWVKFQWIRTGLKKASFTELCIGKP